MIIILKRLKKQLLDVQTDLDNKMENYAANIKELNVRFNLGFYLIPDFF